MDFAGSIMKIDRNTRLLCVHAYQSYVFNMAASHRIHTYGLKVVVGDLVVTDSTAMLEEFEVLQEFENFTSAEVPVDSVGMVSENGETCVEIPSPKQSVEVHLVTDDDVKMNRFTIKDIVIPLLGYESVFPTNIADYLMQLLAREDFTLDVFSKCDSSLRTRGSYRKVVNFAQNFQWSWKQYSDLNEDIVRTELSNFKSGKAKTLVSESNLTEVKSQKALVLDFQLSPGTYATMLIRELTKHSTETLYQAHLTAQYASSSETNVNSTLVEEEITSQAIKRAKVA